MSGRTKYWLWMAATGAVEAYVLYAYGIGPFIFSVVTSMFGFARGMSEAEYQIDGFIKEAETEAEKGA